MILPTIHDNGTSKDQLVKELIDVHEALDTAYRVMKETAPNARDYYPQGPRKFAIAVEEHLGRLKRLDQIKEEIGELIRGIDALENGRTDGL